jgi:signal peptidase I
MRLRRFASWLWTQWVRPLAVPLLCVAAAKSSLADINYVPSGSMEPTILPGDVVVINKLAYDLRVPFTFARLARWSEPQRGDVVVCFAPDTGTRLVKRVVAVPGDTLELRADTLVINGHAARYAALPETVRQRISDDDRPGAVVARETVAGRGHTVMALPNRPALRSFGPITVPAGEFFVMGDNRDNSHDSRFFGLMSRRAIIGKVDAVAVSADLDHWLRPRFERCFNGLE